MFGQRRTFESVSTAEIKEMYEFLTGENVMIATQEDVDGWIAKAKEMGATHVISVCDCFEYDDFPVYVMPNDELDERIAKYNGANMQTINEVIEIK